MAIQPRSGDHTALDQENRYLNQIIESEVEKSGLYNQIEGTNFVRLRRQEISDSVILAVLSFT